MSDTESATAFDCEECLQPAEAFAVVGNETRLAILEALWEAPERPVTFSDLRARVGTGDSAQFNYHLQKLTDQFVRKTDGGYDFRESGRAVIQAVLSGSLNQDPELGPFDVVGNCIDCEAGLEAWYEDEQINVGCPDCGRPHAGSSFPPGGLEGRSNEEVMAAFNQRVRHLKCLSADGVCPACNGQTEMTVEETDSFVDFDVSVQHECLRCGHEITTSVGISLLDDAEVVSFYRDHGIDLNATHFWTLEWCVSDRHTEVVETEPLVVEVEITLDDERLRVQIDESLTVVGADREAL
jgi:Zn ribbon nucleic-acid-binding protein